ncbi:YdcF family protein [Bacillus sp. Marseille-P3661]|uniref:YdcF family protein n=1 Tax=Bacillus sp. Marseille-P3661 TaxID=1936234 RepID=UPI000C823ED2|nr:YdcF family protein [Bacillus sp. Marseille-P3661]
MRSRVKKVSIYIALGFMIWFFIHTVVIIIDGLSDELEIVDAAVVLGNKVEMSGQPAKRLKARLDKSLELYEQGYFKYVIVSGGIGKEGFDEAVVMKDYLVKKGVPSASVFVDSNGYNSFMTAENAIKISKEENFSSVMIISQYFHITRTKLAFKKVGFEETSSAHAEIFEYRDVYSLLREFPAYYKYLLL